MTCPICLNSKNFKKSYLPYFTNCSNCSGNFVSNKKRVKYTESYFLEEKKENSLSKSLKPLLIYFYSLRVKSILNILKNRKTKILDYGCGNGKLVAELNKRKLDCIGYEPSTSAVKLAQRKNLPVYKKIKKISKGYDLIMFWHSLEHSDTPLRDIKNIEKYLKPKGKILIAVPNADSWEAKIAKDKWFHHSYPLHRIAFTPKSLSILLESQKFKIDSIDFFNPEYTISSIVQTFLNFIFPKDILYSVVAQRRSSLNLEDSLMISILSVLLTIFVSPFLFLFFIFALLFKKTSAIIVTATYEKK